jgi:hypothetical protein
MRQLFTLFLLTNFILTGYCQDFKYIKPKLTDSTKVVKTEIDTANQFERIYYIVYSKKSEAKNDLVNLGFSTINSGFSINFTYSSILKNLKTKPKKFDCTLPEKWVKLFKYKGEWILFDDIPKYILTDSCLVSFDLDDPISSVITDLKTDNKDFIFSLLSYNWDNPDATLKSYLDIKVLDPKRMITLWKFYYQNEKNYWLMVPVNQINNFPIMVMLENALMDDENEIFDKIDYEKLWKQ